MEVLTPPHSDDVYNRLKSTSDEWLSHGNRSERGYVMGYFTREYIEKCEVAVIKDANGEIQAFMNLIPAEFDHEEATYDMLRYSNKALGNINDFLLICVCKELAERGYLRINLGMCPLVGLDELDGKSKGLIDSILSFAYANTDRFYSFSGLYRFKSKYKPAWRDRYIIYQGGLRGFTKATNSLVKTMKRTASHRHAS